MNVAIQKTITVIKMPSVQTLMVALYVNVKMDIQEMEQYVMVSDIHILVQFYIRFSLFY